MQKQLTGEDLCEIGIATSQIAAHGKPYSEGSQ
jgi:hypothetical protein